MKRGRKRKEERENEEPFDNGIGPVDALVGSRICARRRLLQMSQKQLAEKLGVTFQQVQKYEKGMNRIGAGRLYSIARILGVEISYFFNEIERDSLVAALDKSLGIEETEFDIDYRRMCKIGFFNENVNQIRFDPLKGAESTMLLKLYYSLPAKSRQGLLMFLNGFREQKEEFDDFEDFDSIDDDE